MMKIVSVVGARPQFVKLAPVHAALSKVADHLIIHTGQHYDRLMSDSFFSDLGIPSPTINLEVGSASHAAQTGRIMESIEPELSKIQPDWVLVYGDTNSTIAAALTAVKLNLPVAHLEAGLRSFNRMMPEEHNRILTDHAADLCLAPTVTAMSNLEREGLSQRSQLVGDVMVDVLHQTMSKLGIPANRSDRKISDSYIATLHRQENTDDSERLAQILRALNSLSKRVILLAHPRLLSKMETFSLNKSNYGQIVFIEPLPYLDLVKTLASAPGLITDSGGLQKEAFLLRVPTVTLRTETEWHETIELGWNILAEPEAAVIDGFLSRAGAGSTMSSPYGDGNSASQVARALLKWERK